MDLLIRPRWLVCGSRGYFGAVPKLDSLAREYGYPPVLAHGACKGSPDVEAGEWAKLHNATVYPYPADWKKHGKAAGAIRNRAMLVDFQPTLVVAFWDGGSPGTLDMIRVSLRDGLRVVIP